MPARARTATQTSAAPAFRNTRAAEWLVAPEVSTSSTSKTRRPRKSNPGDTRNDRRWFALRWAKVDSVCSGVNRRRTSEPFPHGSWSRSATTCAIRSGALVPRRQRLIQCMGIGTTTSHPSSRRMFSRRMAKTLPSAMASASWPGCLIWTIAFPSWLRYTPRATARRQANFSPRQYGQSSDDGKA